MELRELASRVLFATTLEEKLHCPDVITDENPGAAILAPAAPGRPAGLHFKEAGGASRDFPGLHRLEDEHERGRLLHFFGNHELLATELMALVLLRFPDAPAAFRRGVLQTLRDEQEHTRLYIARMRACGVSFGELPVSGYFWRAVSTMENPVDYVAGLCLTFEQANLDFARHYARGFGTVGDDTSAQLLEKIYRDEIGHVAYGLKWFRRWKNPAESDWDAFCRVLKFPLSPQRARGFTVNVEGRRAAGLDADFIARLSVFSQSKGRTPNVFVFNPLAEGHIALGRAFTPVKAQAQLARDLANLPQFLCRQDDIVLVESAPAVGFLDSIRNAGFPLPEFVETRRIKEIAGRKLGTLRPWAWGPDSAALLEPLFASVTGEDRAPGARFHAALAGLYAKSWSADFLRRFLAAHETAPWLCTQAEAGVSARSLDETLAAIAAIRARGHHRVVVKESLGLAGRNAIRLWEPELLDPQRRWMTAALDAGRELVIEPWLERAMDFSAQLEMSGDALRLRGFTGLVTDRKGQFQANWAAPDFARRVPGAVTALFRDMPGLAPRMQILFTAIFAALEPALRAAGHAGPVGIDAFVYRAADGTPRLKPVVEINPRHTMGRLTVELMRHVAPGSHGLFRLVSRKMALAGGCENFPDYARRLATKFPLALEGEPVPKIRAGAVCLNDPATAEACLAIFQVARTGFTTTDDHTGAT